jgi:hypothetical protein
MAKGIIKTIVLILLVMLIPVEVFAVDEEELLDAFTDATGFSYYSIKWTDSYYDFEYARGVAHNKLMLYKNQNDFDWACVEPECHGDFVESLRQCDISLINGDWEVIMLRFGWGGNADAAQDYLDAANEHLGDAYAAWDDYLNPSRASGPSSLHAKAKSSTQIVLGWKDNSNNETGFKVQKKAGACPSISPWTQIATKSANAGTHTVSGLTPDATYSFRVSAYNASGNSAYTNCASAKTGAPGSPPSPSNLKATSLSTTKVNLTWSDQSANETGFKIYRRTGTGAWAFGTATGQNVKSFSDINAPNNSSTTSYQYYVLAFNASGNSPATYTVILPYQPINLAATQGTAGGTIKLTWTDISANETGFEIYRKTDNCSSSTTWAKVATLGANRSAWTDTGRTTGSSYSYKIRSYRKSGSILSAYGYSMYSNCVSAVTP